ncbi:MAG: amidohydrolase family protein, partial [Chloroflexi bacterium]|nr:amidohydrolase family protein [Chloroflexota bacterium]
GGSFLAYPRIISWLMEREARQRTLAEVHPAAGQWSGLASLEREYRLDEIIAMSSSGPARALGLKDRGSLAPGMLADVRCYRLQANTEEMFAHPALVIKNGQVVVEEGEIVSEAPGRTLAVRPEWDGERQPFFDQVLARSVTIDPHQYSIGYTKTAERLGIIPCT